MTNSSVYNENIRLEPKTALDGRLQKTFVCLLSFDTKQAKATIHAEKFAYYEFTVSILCRDSSVNASCKWGQMRHMVVSCKLGQMRHMFEKWL